MSGLLKCLVISAMLLTQNTSSGLVVDARIFHIYHNNDDSYVDLPRDQATFYNINIGASRLFLDLDKYNITAIDPIIGKLDNLEILVLIKDVSIDLSKSKRVDLFLPTELFELPRLNTLVVEGFINLRLSPPQRPLKKVGLQEFHLMLGSDESINFLDQLTSLRTLTSYGGWHQKLPSGIEKLENLQELNLVGNQAVFVPDERLCHLRSLRKLDMFHTVSADYPGCLGELKSLQDLTVSTLGDLMTSDGGRQYFLEYFAALPALSDLTIFTCGSGNIELPKRGQGFQHLKHLKFMGCGGYYPPYDIGYPELKTTNDYSWDLKLDRLSEYPEMETVVIANESLLFSDYLKPDDEEFDRNRIDPKTGVVRLQKLLDQDFRAGRLRRLKKVEIWDRLDGDYRTIDIWLRPTGKKGSGRVALPENSSWKPLYQ